MFPPSHLPSSGQLKLIQFKHNHCRTSNENAAKFINKYSIDICMLQDAYCTEVGKIEGFPTNWAVFPSKRKLLAINVQLVYIYFFTVIIGLCRKEIKGGNTQAY